MLISLDYDKTITADKTFWAEFVRGAQRAGHECIIVTGRRRSHAVEFCGLPVVYAYEDYKRKAAEKAGYKVDIWIDDEPGSVEPGRKLEW